MEKIIKQTANSVMNEIDRGLHINWSKSEKAEKIGILENAKSILNNMIVELDENSWQEQADYKNHVLIVDKNISILNQLGDKENVFYGRIEPKSAFKTALTENGDVVELEFKPFREIVLVFWITGLIAFLLSLVLK